MRVLFICTHNRCRSILSEAVCRHFHANVLEARSAGSQPSGEVHPLSLKYLEQAGINNKGLQSQSWDEFADFDPDLVITVCDSAAKETCPVWFGDAVQLHWGLEDPSKLVGTETEIEEAFMDCIDIIKTRAQILAELCERKLSKSDLEHTLRKITV